MKFKISQVSVFVIFAIVLVIAGISAYIISKDASQSDISREFFENEEIKPSVDSIKSLILQCRGDSAKDSLEMIGIQGGYFNKPEKIMELSTKFIPFHYYEDILNYPDKAMVENELSKSFNQKFLSCIDKINPEGFSVSYRKGKVKVNINKNNVEFVTDTLIYIKKDNKIMTLQMKEMPPVNVNSALYDIIEVSNYIAESHNTNSRMMCISCIGKMAVERNLYVDFVDISESSTLVIISENYTSSEPFSFEFLNKYKAQELLITEDRGVAPKAPVSVGS